MSNNFDQFEQLMSDTLNGYEAPYDEGSWAQMDQSLNQLGKAKSITTITTVAASIAGVGIAIGGFFYFSGNSDAIQQYTAEHITYKTDTSDQPFVENDKTSVDVIAENPAEVPTANNPNVLPDFGNVTHIGNGNDSGDETSNVTPHDSPDNPIISLDNPNHTVVQNPNDPAQTDPIDSGNTAVVQAGNFNIIQSTTEGCEGIFVDFSIDNANLAGDFKWNFGDGTTSSERSTVHSFKKAGDYEVTLTVTNGKNVYVKTADHNVRVFETPILGFTYEISNFNVRPATIFTNNSSQAISYEWNFGDGKTSSLKSPENVYQQKGTYTVILEATNIYGCKSRISQPVNIDRKYNLFAPTGFTPDGDQLNDTWIPAALETMSDVEFTLTIYDSRTGNMVYETKEVNNPWDGRDRSTGTIHNGQYVWKLVIKDQFGQEDVQSGFVTLRK